MQGTPLAQAAPTAAPGVTTTPPVRGTPTNNTPIGTVSPGVAQVVAAVLGATGSIPPWTPEPGFVDADSTSGSPGTSVTGDIAAPVFSPAASTGDLAAPVPDVGIDPVRADEIKKETEITIPQATEAVTSLLKKQKITSFDSKKLGKIKNLLDRNMDLKTQKIPADIRQRYQAWAPILYFGGLNRYGSTIQDRVINNQIKMASLIERIETLQNRELKQDNKIFQNPNLTWISAFLADKTIKYAPLRDAAYSQSLPGVASGVPASPVPPPLAPPQTPVPSPGTASGAASGAATKQTTPNEAGAARGASAKKPATPQKGKNEVPSAQDKRILQKLADGEWDISPMTKKLVAKFGLPVPSTTTPKPGAQLMLQKFADGEKQPGTIGKQLINKFGLPPPTPTKAATASGRGLKHTGLKTVKQIISRTENLIQAANLGNKSTEVRNELDTLLAVLIDRKEVRPQFRTNLMKRLF